MKLAQNAMFGLSASKGQHYTKHHEHYYQFRVHLFFVAHLFVPQQ
jgi:hypothetical protein